ncbi:GNAT family N-acetyltransferase [Nocardia sp. 2YAB30]|uniref:GNAT family N-acetyltransferase n=1 Tax=unclassified Nocardia TaxID=2637762 RepID=UPI003F9869F7
MTEVDGLTVRALGTRDERPFLALRSALTADGRTLAKDYQAGMRWDDYLVVQQNASAGVGLPPGIVPYTFLIAEVDGEFVGSSDIRHTLSDELMRWGGHVGYTVAPLHRRRGYATEILRQTLVKAKDLGIASARLTCWQDNIGSRRVIEACAGQLAAVTADGICQYWIDLDNRSGRDTFSTGSQNLDDVHVAQSMSRPSSAPCPDCRTCAASKGIQKHSNFVG